MLANKRIGIFVTGGIAAYKIAELVRLLVKEGAQVRVAMTQAACEFITPMTLQVLSKSQVLLDTFDERQPKVVQHIEMADWCELAIVAPATANIIGKMANGIADEIASTILMAVTCPRLIVPAMNQHMYENPATQANLSRLVEFGYQVMEPEEGFLAEGYSGKGRMPQPARIVKQAEAIVAQVTFPQLLAGKNVLVTAGGTRERIDPVRFISNDSSGKMGYALAQAAKWLGASVTLVSTTEQLDLPEGVRLLKVSSAQEMYTQVTQLQAEQDYIVMAAAVSDYRVAQVAEHKLKKIDTHTGLHLDLIENPDILAYLGQHKPQKQVLVGFAAETDQVITHAKAKLERKQADWIVANDVSNQAIGFNSDQNQVVLLSRTGQVVPLAQMAKVNLALEIWQIVASAQKEGK